MKQCIIYTDQIQENETREYTEVVLLDKDYSWTSIQEATINKQLKKTVSVTSNKQPNPFKEGGVRGV